MDNQNTEAQDLIVKAREALRRGDKETARALGEQAALLAPDMESVWLVLTAAEPNPEDALAYAQQALEINPSSERALKAVEWSIARLKQSQAAETATAEAVAAPVSARPEEEKPGEAKKSNNRIWLYVAAGLAILLCIAAVYMAYTGVTQPVFNSILANSIVRNEPVPTQENLWAPMMLAKPPAAPFENGSPAQQAGENTPTAGSTQESESLASATPALAETAESNQESLDPTTPAPGESAGSNQESLASATPAPGESAGSTPTKPATSAPEVTETPGVISMEIVEDTPTSQYVTPASSGSSAPLPEAAASGGARWIDVDLTNQTVYAYQGDTVVNSFLVSTGTWLHPTVTGQYNIYVKYRSAPMSGPGYYLPNVPYIMYFYKGYGLHGTYWHSNFGTPMSHGCVNLRTDEAAWLYNWASVGTLVNVHY